MDATQKKLTTEVLRSRKGVAYMVIDEDLDITVWHQFIPFGKDPEHQPGGAAFTDAERRMKRQAGIKP